MARMVCRQYNHNQRIPNYTQRKRPMFVPYIANSLSIAYQLRWSLAVFPTVPFEKPIDWIAELSHACEPDGIRVLEASVSTNGSLLLLLSTKPNVVPATIVQRVKGRLQHLLRDRGGIAWRRNFRLTAVGDANVNVVEQYVANQLDHHPTATAKARINLQEAQWRDPTIDVSVPIQSSHGQYSLGLHVVLVHAERWLNADGRFVEITQTAIRGTLVELGCPASQISLLADHVHIVFRLRYDLSPGDVIVKVMNEVCESQGGLRMWMEGFYVGTVGSYDMAALRNSLVRTSLKSHDSIDARSKEIERDR